MSELCGGPVKGLLCDITGVLRESSSTDDGICIPVSFSLTLKGRYQEILELSFILQNYYCNLNVALRNFKKLFLYTDYSSRTMRAKKGTKDTVSSKKMETFLDIRRAVLRIRRATPKFSCSVPLRQPI